ncbi:MAG: PfkB family carbohydrate kinase [Patescibacteria group bacterium]|nr:PfkB family carbohydrate kinase [Patescibacteria group bacterium]
MIIVTGSIAYDYIMTFPGSFGDHILPEQIHNVNLSFIVSNFARHRGGTAGNVSYTMNLLHTPHILYSYAGKDFDGYKKELKKLGIAIKGVKIDKTSSTATGFAMTDKSNNQIWGYYYGASLKNSKLILKKVVKKDDLILIGPQGAKASICLIKQCINLNIPYMFDPGFILTEVSSEELELGVKHAKFIVGNEYEINLIKERLDKWSTIVKKKTVITTLGEKGVLIKSEKQTFSIKAAKAKSVSSTTGAGDAWRGGFLAGLTKGFNFKISGQMGCVAASFAIEHYGTQEHFYTKNEFKNRYRQNYGSLLKL